MNKNYLVNHNLCLLTGVLGPPLGQLLVVDGTGAHAEFLDDLGLLARIWVQLVGSPGFLVYMDESNPPNPIIDFTFW